MRFRDWIYQPFRSIVRVFDRSNDLQKQHEKRERQHLDIIDNLQGMANAIPDAALVIDRNDVITWFNNPAKQLLGIRESADQGQVLTRLIPDPGFADWLAVQDEVPGKLCIPCPVDEEIPLQISVTRFGNNQRLLILRDIADVENLDRIRRDLIANISHELRTPLTVLLGYLELVQDQPDNLDSKTAKSMFKQARQMHALLQDLLELSRLQDTEIRSSAARVDMKNMLTQLKEQAEEYGKGDHELLFEIQPDLDLSGIEADLRSAFQNLLINAVNYTPPGGTIRVSWQSTDEGLLLTVKDSGIGIPKKDLPRITERFYRVGRDRARQTGGTGLGLAIVKHVLNSHQARLEISSELGKGSEFRCIFPHTRQA
jgi:two-component system phosphate regulon sensor histidine kinase PhoR